MQKNIRRANLADIPRISEIYVFNNRLVYYPIFNNVEFSFKQLLVTSQTKKMEAEVHNTYVYDDGVIKGFVIVSDGEIKKLHVDYFFTGKRIGSCLLEFALHNCSANFLWTLERNEFAIHFYKKHGFEIAPEKKALYNHENHAEYCVKMQHQSLKGVEMEGLR